MLSPNFSQADLERSDFAIRNGIKNTIPEEQLHVWQEGLINIVEPLAVWDPNLVINSAFRSEELNRRIGGSKNSQHQGLFWMAHRTVAKFVPCCAFDLLIPGPNGNRKLWNRIALYPPIFDQLLWEFGDDNNPAWVHISYVPNEINRREVLRVKKTPGGTQYTALTLMPGQPEKSLAHTVNPQPPLPSQSTIAGGSAQNPIAVGGEGAEDGV